MINSYSDIGRVAGIFERMQPGFKEEQPPCIDKHGHYFKTCGQCFTMICRRCQYKTIDFAGQMTTTYGDFSGTHAPYDRYCSECEVLLQRGTDGWKCYEDYEKYRLSNNQTICGRCNGTGKEKKWWGKNPEELVSCIACEGDGRFPAKYRRTQIEQGKKITEVIDEPFWKRIKDDLKIFIHNHNPWSSGIITKLKKLSI